MPTPKQLSEEGLRKFYDELLRLNREAFEGGQLAMSYHLLMSALYAAQGLSDLEDLEKIQQVATEQLAWIDEHASDYEHSSLSASQRGHPNIYQNLIRQVRARQAIIRSDPKAHTQNNL